MVLRSSDQPTGLPDNVKAASDRLDALQRDLGRGGSALRAGEHVVVLNPDSGSPMFTPLGTDSGLAFRQGRVAITGPDGVGNRDVETRGISALGNINTLGNVTATGSGVFPGGLGSNNGATINGQINLAGNLAMGFNQIFAGDIHVQNAQMGNITGVNGNYSANQVAPRFIATIEMSSPFYGGASDRRLKHDVRPVTDSSLPVINKIKLRKFEWNKGEGPEGTQVGVVAQELPTEMQHVAGDEHGTLSYSVTHMLARAVGAIQELSQQNDALRARLDALEAA